MANDDPPSTDRPFLDRAERLLADRGHDLGIGRARIAADGQGIAIGFPADPIIHVSWWAVLVLALLPVVSSRLRR